MRVNGLVVWVTAAASIGTWLGPNARAQTIKGTVEQHSFVGPLTGKTVLYNIYLPEGYSTSTQRYPVIYHLHGIGGNQGGGQNTQVPASFETALAACRIGPVVVVFPNGYVDNFWADSFNGTEPAESNVIPELVEHVDSSFRTIPNGSNRVIEGFSMGGFGTMKFFSKFPGFFACAVEYDGALSTWNDIVQFQPQVASAVFNNSEAYFNAYSPWTWTSANAAILRQGTNIRMAAGALVTSNRRFRDFLTGLTIPFEYVETGCDHTLPCLLNSQGQNNASFMAARLKPFVADANTCRAGTATLSVLAQGKAPFSYQWQIADPAAPGGWRAITDGGLIVGGQTVASITGAAAQTLGIDLAGHGISLTTAQFRCVVTSACAVSTSNAALFDVCLADFNCDGFVDPPDYNLFINEFEAGSLNADFNADGFLDPLDYNAFINAFEAGC